MMVLWNACVQATRRSRLDEEIELARDG